MKKMITIMLLGLTLSSCSLLRPHKYDVEQGNIITQEDVQRLHIGMTESQVKSVMGNPVMVNVFSPNRLDYIYTFQAGYGKRQQKRVVCIFQRGRLNAVLKN